MRLLHTADWHAGRSLRGLDRTAEIAAALEEILALAKSEQVDAILVSGDLFDTRNPGADAERAVYEFFLRAGESGIPSVVIAGNHDSPERLESVSGLLGQVGVRALGRVRLAHEGGVVALETKSNEHLRVAALPYLSERRLVKAATLLEADVGQWKQKYRQGTQFFIDQLAKGFEPNAVNVMMLHATLDGGKLSGSEYTFGLGDYAISVDALPSSAQYVAMGHLHRPQRLGEAPIVEYAGSVVQLDFGEAGESKVVKIIEASAGRPARVTDVPLGAGKPLKNIKTDLESLERRLEEHKHFSGYLKVVVRLQQPMPGLKDRVLAVLPQALAVEVELEGAALAPTLQDLPQAMSPLEAYERYVQEKRGHALSNEVRQAFIDLQNEVMQDGAVFGSDELMNEGGSHAPTET